MKIFNKLKNKRGTTFVEVMIVIAVLSIMLGLAVPNILSQSQEIKLAALDGYARSVAVAVQSKLYGMKNKGTLANSEYQMLNDSATEVGITTAEGEKEVRYFTNFGSTKNMGAQILSGALTDTELLQKGKIVVVYYPPTADVVEVFYSEKEFPVDDDNGYPNGNLFPTVSEPYLKRYRIGIYRGDPKPEIEYNIGLPRFSVAWQDDDEKYLELTMRAEPDPQLLNKRLGLEVYALLPEADSTERDPLLIYAEGLVANDYTATNATNGKLTQTKDDKLITENLNTIKSEDSASLTLKKIQDNNGKLRFAIDSMVIPSADYDSATVKAKLYRQNHPGNVSAAESVLYPRDSLDHWLDQKFNPYISFGKDAELYETSTDSQSKLDDSNKKVTDYVAPNQKLQLQVKLYVLKEENGSYTTESISGGGNRYVEDENYAPVTITSQPANPYFYSSSSDDDSEIALASVRDLQNLKYIFETNNKVTRAQLYHDIDTQQFYDKLVRVRYALIKKDPNVKDEWPGYANADTLQVAQITYADGNSNRRSSFTISGSKGEDGCYAIKSVQTGGAGWGMGGFIQFAKNITVENLDIVNPKVWKINFNTNLIQTDDDGKITGINVQWDNGVSGGLFGVAENCTFTNVHCYNDNTQIFKQEPWEADSYKPEEWVTPQMGTRYVGGSVAGGLVGIAVGTDNKGTTFTNCGASTQVNSYYYGAMAQCIYAGGLVGIAMGNVEIKNSYAACQLSGYYSGGLVGAVAAGPFKYHVNYRDGKWEADYTSPLTGTLTIENSFSAGHIQRQTMVGGGLIAQTNDVTVNATNCYSASVWEILPPIAYGTFEGDETNYYLVQDEINVPITLNTEARFKRTAGDVFSLNSSGKGGKAVTADDLKTNLTDWGTATRTLQWYNKGNGGTPTFLLPTDAESGSSETKSKDYPFPMPKDNTKFWGDWNKDNANNISANSFAASLDGFYCVYFKRGDDGYQRFIEGAAVLELKFDLNGNTLKLLDKEISKTITKPEDIWWASNKQADNKTDVTAFGTGVAGMTDVTVSNGNITFTGAAYYNKSYNPIKGYVGIDKACTNSNSNDGRYLNWDYYGWYVSNGLYKVGYLAPSVSGGELSNSDFTVKEDEFKTAIGYGSFTFKKNGNQAQIVYDDGHFQAVEKKEA